MLLELMRGNPRSTRERIVVKSRMVRFYVHNEHQASPVVIKRWGGYNMGGVTILLPEKPSVKTTRLTLECLEARDLPSVFHLPNLTPPPNDHTAIVVLPPSALLPPAPTVVPLVAR
jgi:hypothetical protein